MKLSGWRSVVWICLVALWLSSCRSIEAPSVLEATPSLAVPTATLRRTAVVPPQPALPTATAITPPAPVVRPASGWTLFTNPDFVRGVTVANGSLWAATQGGVVQWNLRTEKPVLYTTREGLVDMQGNDIVYCHMPRERIVVVHDSGVLSAYDLELQKWLRVPITFGDGSTLTGARTLLCDEQSNRLLVGGTQGLAIYDFRTDRWSLIGAEQGLPESQITAIDVIGQTIWLAAGERGAFMIMGNTIFPFNGASGFPAGPVNDLAISSDRSIWLGYPTGLVHYVERRWNSYGGKTFGGLRLTSIDNVEMGLDGVVWIADQREGVCPFDVGTLFCSTVYRAPNDAPITDLVVDADGVAYAATDGAGVLVLGKERKELVFQRGQLSSNDILDIAADPNRRIWVSTSRGVDVFDAAQSDQPWERFDVSPQGIDMQQVHLLSLPGGMWFFDQQEPQAAYWDGEQWLRFGEAEGLESPVLAAEVDQRGYVWLATADGLYVWDGSILRPQRLGGQEPNSTFHSLLEQDGVMWVGSDQGLQHQENFQWSTDLPGLTIYAILESKDGTLLLGTERGLIRYVDGQSFQWVINLGEEVWMDRPVTALAYDGNGDLWVGTDGFGLYHYDGLGWEQLDTASGDLPAEHITRIISDPYGGVWIVASSRAGGGGLLHFMP